MRLLKREPSDGATDSHKFSLTEFHPSNIPSKYAILSHRWGGDEVTLSDLVSGTAQSKPGGYRKLEFCAAQAAHDGIDYFWIDTCCINKESSAELSEAINSMFKWYQGSAKCYVYLPDVSLSRSKDTISSDPIWVSAFQASTWFTRGWTLQELVAPRTVEFFSLEGTRLGDKSSLEQLIHNVTKIPLEALRGSRLTHFTREERFLWTAGRRTTVEEDAAYCLMGLFDVHMPLLYGEGQQKALARLRRKVEKSSHPVLSHVATPLGTVPFERNPRFTGREAELAKLEAQLFETDHTSIWAITGLGGVGKTQLVLELLYRVQAKNPDCTVMWIPAATRESLHQGYSAVARQLNIPGHEDKNADVEALLQHHLAKVDKGRWLLVFDNADDINLWTAVPKRPGLELAPRSTVQTSRLIDRLPKNKRGCIIFTTRDRKLATKLAGPSILAVSEMGKEAATKLLSKYLDDPSFFLNHQQDVAKLLEELTYIIENEITVAEYVQLLREKEEEVIDLLSADFNDHGRYQDTKNPIATTWLISFEQIRRRDQLAAEYLSFMACIHPKDIPRSLLPPGPSSRRELEAIATLTAYSFVSRRPTGDFFDLHRLVHLATRNWLRKEQALSSSLGIVVTRLEKLFPDADDWERDVWRMYLPHILQVLESDEFQGSEEYKIVLMSRCGRCLCDDGRWKEAETLFNQVLMKQESSLVQTDASILEIKSWLARTYNNQGRWAEAEQLAVHTLEASRMKLGVDHPHTLHVMGTLAWIYKHFGRWSEAAQLQIEVLKTRKIKLGSDHVDTLRSMSNLALTYRSQGRLSEAEQLQAEVAQRSKAKRGADHRHTLIYEHTLGSIYYHQGRLVEAEHLLTEVTEKRKSQLGSDHLHTLDSITDLADVYRKQNRLTEAEELQRQALEAYKRKIGADHPLTLNSMHNLAHTWRSLGKDEEAIQLMEDAVQRRAQVIGVQHPDYLLSIATLHEWEAEDLDEQGTQQSILTSDEVAAAPLEALTLVRHDVDEPTTSSSDIRQRRMKLSHLFEGFRQNSRQNSPSRRE